MNKIMRRFVSVMCSVGLSFTMLPVHRFVNKSIYYIKANAEYDLLAEFPDVESYVTHCLTDGFLEPETGEQSDFSFYTTFMNRSFAYDGIAEGVMNKTGAVIASQFYQLITTIASSGIAKLDELSQKEMYEVFIMDYLQYEYSSSEYQSQFDENVLMYSKSIYKELVDYAIDMGKDKNYLKQLTKEERHSVIADAKFLKKNVKPYMKVMDEIDKVSSTLDNYQNNVATILAIAEANEGKIKFLKGVRSQAIGNESLCAALDDVIKKLENSADAISVETIEQGIDITLDWAWGEISEILKNKFPELKAIDKTTDVLDAILNTSNQSSNVIRIILLYTFEQYAIQATRISHTNYVKDKSEENASEFNSYFSAYLAYQSYASNWSKQFASAGLLEGFLNNLKNCFSDANKETYAYWEKKLNNDCSQCKTAQDYMNNCYKLYFEHLDGVEDDSNTQDPPISIPDASIESGVFSYNGNTYQIIDKSMTWSEAKSYCENLGGHLVSINSSAENYAVSYALLNHKKNVYWIGLYKSATSSWNWVTGEKVDYENWADGEPNNLEDNESVGEIYNYLLDDYYENCFGQWNDVNTNGDDEGVHSISETGLICEWEGEYNEIYNNIAESKDKAFFNTTFNGHIYQLFEKNITWTDAEKYCEGIGGHLATITSEKEQNFIQEMLYQYGTHDAYWLGATDIQKEGNWKWINKETFNYTNWCEGAPDNYDEIDPNGENYLGILNADYLWGETKAYRFEWNDFSEIDDYIFGFICEWDSLDVETSPLEDSVITNNNHSYKVIYTDMTEKEAQQIAESAGGHLVTVDSDLEQTIISILTENVENNYYVIEWDNSYMSLEGDVNLDGKVDVSDVVLLQKWLLVVPNTYLPCWKAGDLFEDEKLDVFDFCLLKRKLING